MKWYGVKSIFYEDGAITAKLLEPIISPARPDDTMEQRNTMDIYIEYFPTRESAQNHILESANTTMEAKRAAQLSRLHELSGEIATLIQELDV